MGICLQNGTIPAAAVAGGTTGEAQCVDGDVVDVTPAAKDGTFAGAGVVQEPLDAETQAGRGCPGATQPTTPELSERRLTVVRHSPFFPACMLQIFPCSDNGRLHLAQSPF